MVLIEKNIGKRVENLRKTKHIVTNGELKRMNQKELSDLLYINVNQYRESIKGQIPFSIKSLLTISKLYNVDANYILFGGIK